MARLRKVDCSGPGITRRRRGKGFEYLDDEGRKISEAEVLERISDLGIPPAWEDVWICPYPLGHLQATGIDARGRKQYLYHQKWRERKDQEKFDNMLDFARSLPAMRERVDRHLAGDELTRERVLACAVRLLERGFFRIGTEDYAEVNETYGLATMRKDHVTVGEDGEIAFDYAAKGGKRRLVSVVDPASYDVVAALKRRRGGSPELLAWKQDGRWRDVKSDDINAYVKEITGGDFSAKAFRTWSATVLAAVALAVSRPARATKTGRKRAKARAVKEVATYLGNTPAVARASYIDPRLFDRFDAGYTIAAELQMIDVDGPGDVSLHGEIEEAVLHLLEDNRASDLVESVKDSVLLAA